MIRRSCITTERGTMRQAYTGFFPKIRLSLREVIPASTHTSKIIQSMEVILSDSDFGTNVCHTKWKGYHRSSRCGVHLLLIHIKERQARQDLAVKGCGLNFVTNGVVIGMSVRRNVGLNAP